MGDFDKAGRAGISMRGGIDLNSPQEAHKARAGWR